MEVVMIERSHFKPSVWERPWVDLLGSARAGERGLSILAVEKLSDIRWDMHRRAVRLSTKAGDVYTWTDVDADVAIMRCGDKGRSFLLAQNWID